MNAPLMFALISGAAIALGHFLVSSPILAEPLCEDPAKTFVIDWGCVPNTVIEEAKKFCTEDGYRDFRRCLFREGDTIKAVDLWG
jgi:hypothetical protein